MSQISSKLIIILFLITLLSSSLYSQERHFKVELSSGVEAGEWTESYHLQKRPFGSYQAISLPIQLALIRQYEYFSFGIEIKNSVLFNESIGYRFTGDGRPYTPFLYRKNIAKGKFINFTALYGTLRCMVIQKNIYNLTPCFSAGTFIENSNHESKQYFKEHFTYKLELKNEIKLNSFNLFFSPVLSRFYMNAEVPEKTSVNISFWGIDMGIAYLF